MVISVCARKQGKISWYWYYDHVLFSLGLCLAAARPLRAAVMGVVRYFTRPNTINVIARKVR